MDSFLKDFIYITGVKGLFPIDYNFQKEGYQPEYCLRPELVAEWRDLRNDMSE